MDKSQAKKLVEDIFQNSFDRENYQLFLRNLLNDFVVRDQHYSGSRIPSAYSEHVRQYWRIGKYVDFDGIEMDLLVVELKSLSKLDHARSMLRNFSLRTLKTFGKECALIAFYAHEDNGAEWRFSFVKIEHQAFRDDKGRVRIKDEFTPARRCSYLVGKHENSHTAEQQLLPLLERDYTNPRIEEIEAAFSIEKVTDEFFEQYKGLYLKLSEQLKRQPMFLNASGDETSNSVARFAKKLLGQIVFLYFLQKKRWLGVAKDDKWDSGSRRFMRDHFELIAEGEKNYYRDFLQFLFYEALAKERKDQDDPDYYQRFDCKIPFLNGGLFERDDMQIETIDLPNSLFHNKEKGKSGDEGTGILDIFDRYNFTIKEDEPLEKEVAVDPEMLGKVFENMLEWTERKSMGAFYTPREIVHYMCQESLIHYLDNVLNNAPPVFNEIGHSQTSFFGNEVRTGQLQLTEETEEVRVPKEDIETLIRKGHLFIDTLKLPESVRQHAQLIDNYLASIRACDPAIGSGAFPVGLLHEIVTARMALAEHLEHPQTIYALKRHTIRESLYGVDIDQSAIDIARLRLWLSLIVDEEDYNTIEALPNLDYKIVRGNSLIGLPSNVLKDDVASQLIEIMKFDFYEETEELKRKEKRKAIDSRLHEFLATARQYTGYTVDFDFELFFSEVWHQKGGFDVVIGNPPYVQIQNFSGKEIQKTWEKQNYETFAKTGDIYCLFYEKGFRLLRKKGVLAFITSNKWMRAGYGEKIRRFFLKQTAICQLIDFGDSPIFSEATTYTNILLFEKTLWHHDPKVWDLSAAYLKATSLLRMLEDNPQGTALFSEESFVIAASKLAAIKKQIEAVGVPLKKWDISMNYGIKTGYNDAFIIDGKKKDELIALDPKNVEIIKPILRGRDVKRYSANFADLWLIATFPALDINIDEYPAVRGYLKSFGKKLHQTGEVIDRDDQGNVIKSRKATGNKWFETQDQIAYYKEFEKEKIVYAEIVFDSAFYLDTSGIYPEATAFVLTGENTRYLTALLNSQLLTFVFRAFYAGGDLRGDTFRYKKVFLQNLPVIKSTGQVTSLLELLVDYVQTTKVKKQNLQSAFFEQLIDALVYELYFSDELKRAGKEIQKHLGDVKPVSEHMTDTEKLAIIQSEFDRLYDPNHPVRNNIETLDSVDEVRIIREALKR
ncbi:MAG: Eco57I restriction-modification methylase domain-containing protein [Chlorobiaceae bacterium]